MCGNLNVFKVFLKVIAVYLQKAFGLKILLKFTVVKAYI